MNEAEAYRWMQQVLRGNKATEDLVADLVAIEDRGVSVDELVGCAQAMRDNMERIHAPGLVLDTCGTGGARLKTFNISTPCAFLLADAGITVAKHGNRSVTRPSGSADLLEAAGANLELPPAQVEAVLRDAGIAFLFAPVFHASMRHAAEARRLLGTRTIFNRLGPLANPAGASHQLIGVGELDEVALLADALARLGGQGLVLHGEPGFDEATPCGLVHYRVVGEMETYQFDPASVGMVAAPANLEPLQGKAAQIRFFDILNGNVLGPVWDTICLNVAFGLMAAGKVSNVVAGIAQAQELTGKGKWDAYLAATRSHA